MRSPLKVCRALCQHSQSTGQTTGRHNLDENLSGRGTAIILEVSRRNNRSDTASTNSENKCEIRVHLFFLWKSELSAQVLAVDIPSVVIAKPCEVRNQRTKKKNMPILCFLGGASSSYVLSP